ncbi:hypothetical protein [Shiella aurantiaca]|uniref:hypothetical protein n=1 Tax=Shiella aurantiaca TaxID=3058365 RepID=UPI0029F5CBA3|nr:hypothetical protein [Shiella aurantiaca]
MTYHVKPTSNKKDINDTKGAFVNCYIVTDTLKNADKIARQEIEEMDWFILEREEVQTIDNESIEDDKKEYYEQALIDKTVFVFYTYPEL